MGGSVQERGPCPENGGLLWGSCKKATSQMRETPLIWAEGAEAPAEGAEEETAGGSAVTAGATRWAARWTEGEHRATRQP